MRAANETGDPEVRRSAGALAIQVDTVRTCTMVACSCHTHPQLQTIAMLLVLQVLAFSSPASSLV